MFGVVWSELLFLARELQGMGCVEVREVWEVNSGELCGLQKPVIFSCSFQKN